AAPVVRWLKELQAVQVESRFDFVPLAEIQGWSDVARGVNLFDSIVVFENYPIDDDAAVSRGLRVRNLRAVEITSYPLSVIVSPGQQLSFLLGYDSSLFDAATVERMAGHLRTLLLSIAADPGCRVDDLPMLTEAERHQVLEVWSGTGHDVAPLTL